MAEELRVLRGEGEELRKMNRNMFRACEFSHESAPGPQQQNQYSLQDHLELKAMRNELLESRLAVARPMETQRKKKASLRKQVSDGYVAAV